MAQNKEETQKRRSVAKILTVIIAATIVLVAGMGIGITVFGETGEESLLSRFTSEDTETEHAIALNEFLVNISGESTRSKAIVRMEITVTSMDDGAEEIINQEIAKVRDAVIHVVAGQTDATILEEDEGDFIIKDKIRDRINHSLNQDLIEEVYVTNILIQN
ncbi:MAG: flagellar basal body-associated FliL family protein [Alkalibacterium sp.]|nr:flagellar basal body-associated FliL family protein [Alkalibacterium sp.]